MSLTLNADRVVTPAGLFSPGAVVVSDDGSIEAVRPGERIPVRGEGVSLEGCTLAPGLIDVHTHGGHGITFGTPGRLAEDLAEYSEWVAASGVAGFLCSVAAPDSRGLLEIVKAYAGILARGTPGAQALGLHLEGPFLNPARKGAFNPAWLRPPSSEEMSACLEAGAGWVRQITLAPELPGALEIARMARERGVVAALGHSDADYETAAEALRGDFTHVTHTFNAQRGFGHREPGVLGAVLVSDRATAELIADTIHVHPAAMKLLVRCLGASRIVLVTDAMAGAGLADGLYELVGHKVRVSGGKATLADGTLAGSTATMNACVRNLMRETGLPLEAALATASANPARVLGLSQRWGSLETGMEAHLTAFDGEMNVRLVMVRGRIVFRDL
jgi:N-acetylglucosamine-6-phosphate deacetylase